MLARKWKMINIVRREKNRREAVWNGRVTTHRVGERKKGWSMPRTIRNLYEFSMSNTNTIYQTVQMFCGHDSVHLTIAGCAIEPGV